MLNYLSIGALLGISAGLTPGPLLMLIIAETLRKNIMAGIKVALAPVITDLPIVLITWYLLSKLTKFHFILGLIAVVGGCFILILGIGNLRSKGFEVNLENVQSRSFSKGVLVNILSPHPYLFWVSIGGPIISRAMSLSYPAVIAFIAAFYVFLLGAKMSAAVVVGKTKTIIAGKPYLYVMRFLGLALIVLAIFLFRDGFQLFGWI